MADEATNIEESERQLASEAVRGEDILTQMARIGYVVERAEQNMADLDYLKENGFDTDAPTTFSHEFNATTVSMVVTSLNVLGFFVPDWTDRLKELATSLSDGFEATHDTIPQEEMDRADAILNERAEAQYEAQLDSIFGGDIPPELRAPAEDLTAGEDVILN